MLRRITVRNFKSFREQSFDLGDSVVLAGPNNAGKTTLLQAISAWKFALDRWLAQREGSRSVRRAGVPITRSDFTPAPLREMNMLWEDRRVTGKAGMAGARRMIEIVAEGESRDGPWTCGMEFQYANRELLHARPQGAKNMSPADIAEFPAAAARDLDIVFVPPFSGIEREEPRRELGFQELLIGQGRPGEILRNLLYEVSARKEADDWRRLSQTVDDLFRIELRKPVYSAAQPFIVSEYREKGHKRQLDLANAGSGTLQVLLVLAFLYARRASVILLDEPDAHQHVILQHQVYDLIRKVARERGGQVVLATHSEVVLDATAPEQVIGFLGETPRALTSSTERNALREALKRITTTELLQARDVQAVLYLEGETDEKILREWARILGHPARAFFDRPFVHWLRGSELRDARNHYFALRAVVPELRAVCLLDGDNRDDPDDSTTAAGLRVLRWRRYEIENYLLQPSVITRFAAGLPLLEDSVGADVENEFWKQVPPGTDLFGDHVSLVRVKASIEFLVPLFEQLGRPTQKKDLYLLAAEMRPEETHPGGHGETRSDRRSAGLSCQRRLGRGLSRGR